MNQALGKYHFYRDGDCKIYMGGITGVFGVFFFAALKGRGGGEITFFTFTKKISKLVPLRSQLQNITLKAI